MTINISDISSILNSTQSLNVSKTNNYTLDFSQYLLQSMSNQQNVPTIGDDIAAATQLNINDPASLQNAVQKMLGANRNPFVNQLGMDENPIFSNVLWNNNSASTIDAQSMFNVSTSNRDVLTDALQSNFASKQMSVMQSAYATLQKNLEDYQARNRNNPSEAVHNRIAEMTRNINAVQGYIQEKLSTNSMNENLMNQLNAKSSIASIPFK